MNNMFLLIALFSVIIASFSQVMLKLGAGKVYNSKIREYLNFYVITGYGMLFLSMILTIVAYSHLSYLSVPVVEAVGYVLVPVLSYLIFKEKLTKRKLLGILFILLGIMVYYTQCEKVLEADKYCFCIYSVFMVLDEFCKSRYHLLYLYIR